MLCFLNNLYVSLNVNMKKTQFKLILNSNSYRIYTDNGIEYCRFKKKYYPLTEIENVINSYKIGGVPTNIHILDLADLANAILDAFLMDKIGTHWKEVTKEKLETTTKAMSLDCALSINGFKRIS